MYAMLILYFGNGRISVLFQLELTCVELGIELHQRLFGFGQALFTVHPIPLSLFTGANPVDAVTSLLSVVFADNNREVFGLFIGAGCGPAPDLFLGLPGDFQRSLEAATSPHVSGMMVTARPPRLSM